MAGQQRQLHEDPKISPRTTHPSLSSDILPSRNQIFFFSSLQLLQCESRIYIVHSTQLTTLWLCPPIKHFWQVVTTTLSTFLSCSIPLSPSKYLLCDLDIVNPNHNTPTCGPITKKTILLNWKSRGGESQWLNLLTKQISMEKLFNKIYSTVLRSILLPMS